MSIKILHIVSMLESGGVENMLYNYSCHMDETIMNQSFASHSLGGQISEKLIAKGNYVYYVSPKRNGLLKYFKNLIKLLQCTKWDIIHVHQNFGSIIPLAIAKIVGISVRISHAHGSRLRDRKGNTFYEKLLSIVLRFVATDFMACGNEAAIWMFGRKSVKNNRVVIIKNAIDLDKFSFSEINRKNIRNTLNIDFETKCIGQVARMTEEKNHEFALLVYYEYLKNNANSRLIFIGDGPLRNKIEKKAISLGIKYKVLFIGNVDNVAEYLSAFDLLILPSIHEGLPLTPIEAQANGLRSLISTGVPYEVSITKLVSFLDLEKGVTSWADEMKIILNNEKREDVRTDLKAAGYDCVSAANVLEKLYIKLYNRKYKKINRNYLR